ncbi:hypothetical protein ACFSSB_15695 [Lacinutrix gracilariae]|uniref:YD repeat-containing protein n=1 Tax=Lacinutrix gracilariae TaxID=1747198 RepID=A0ABW5K761_9FLAO
MKKIIWFFLLIFIIQNTFSQVKFDPKQLELNGNVKSLLEIDYEDPLKEKVTGYIIYSEFDKNGKIINKTYSNSKNEPSSSKIYHYDINGNDSICHYENKQKKLFKTTLTKTVKKNNSLSVTITNLDSTFIQKIVYEYDKSNNLVSKKKYVKKDTLKDEMKYSYDSANNMTEWKWLNSNDSNTYRRTYEYKKNLLKHETRFYKERIYLKKKYKYNLNKKIRKVINYNLKDSLTTKIIYSYNKDKVVIRETTKKENGLKSQYVFKYDNQNNWIELKSFKNKSKTAEYILTRKIEYY